MKLDYNTLKRNALESFFANANDMQRRAVFRVNGQVLILAGAGSGKTTVLCSRAANMMLFGNAYEDTEERSITDEERRFLESFPEMEKTPGNAARLAQITAVSPVKPYNILAITFTNKAAEELKSRLISTIGEDAKGITASTFHSACLRILRREIEHTEYKSGITIYDESDKTRLIKDIMKKLNIDEKMFKEKSIKNIISRCKDRMISSAEFAVQAESSGDLLEKRAAEVYPEYQAALRGANAVDFDDLLYLTVKLFEENPDVLDHYRRLYKYIMVDEYQDTNLAQYRLISLLAGRDGNLCVVGDDDQSIYRFRGADISNILNFEKQYSGCTVIRLEQNYRSTENILNAANSVISNNSQRKDKTLWSDLGKGAKIQCVKFDDDAAEARFVANTVLDGIKNGKRYSDFAVLYRTNAQSRSFEGSLARAGVPYATVGGLRFFDRKEIKDILSYLALLNNPFDSVRFRRVINEPKRGIGDATVEEIIRISEGLSISPIEVCRDASQYQPLSRKTAVLKAAANLFDELNELADTLPLDELIGEVVRRTGYEKAMRDLGTEGVTRMENINELRSNALAMMEEDPDATLQDFLEQTSLVSDLDSGEEDGTDRVSLMTIHSAKGLEFDTVFLVGAEDNIFPSYRSKNDSAEMEEERRLAYVAITRAKKELFVTHTVHRTLYGKTDRNELSTFIREIKEDCIEHKNMSSSADRPSNSGICLTRVSIVAPNGACSMTFSTGERVRHSVFGVGTINEVKRVGNDTMLTISFDSGQTKNIMANYARLEKM